MDSEWLAVERDFRAWMKYRNLAASTQQIYTSAVRELAEFLTADGRGLTPADVHRRDIEAFVRHRLEQVKPATVSADFRPAAVFQVAGPRGGDRRLPRRRRPRSDRARATRAGP